MHIVIKLSSVIITTIHYLQNSLKLAIQFESARTYLQLESFKKGMEDGMMIWKK